jgi:valyl-tRNA synthetase
VIDTPPPYPSGKWHVGGAAHYAQIDMIARYFRMKGWNVFVPWYADRNGLPVEVAVEKKYGISAHEMASTPEGRRKFL